MKQNFSKEIEKLITDIDDEAIEYLHAEGTTIVDLIVDLAKITFETARETSEEADRILKKNRRPNDINIIAKVHETIGRSMAQAEFAINLMLILEVNKRLENYKKSDNDVVSQAKDIINNKK